jgi:photosystem II stability/assembly factor-like uncharacterized protein
VFPLLLIFSPGLGSSQAHPQAVSLTPLDGGKPAVHGVHVMAMAVGSGGTLYAGGRHVVALHEPNEPRLAEVGSVFMVSHDHGAHWSMRVSDEPPPGVLAHLGPWKDHTRWPNNFTVYQLVVDRSHPTIIYAVGGFPFSIGDRGQPHLLLRTTDGGRTWADVLVHSVNLASKPPLVTNILVTPANRQDLTYRRSYYATNLAIDPRDPRHLYLATDALGVLQSKDGGATWRYYAASPSAAPHVFEHLIIDLQHPKTLYLLVQDTTIALLYRSDDGGATWRQVWHGGFASTILLEGHALYLSRGDGVYASTDRGMHWRLAVNPRTLPGFTTKSTTVTGIAGTVLQALHDRQAGVWDVVTDIDVAASPFGFFTTSNGGATWALLTHGLRAPDGTLALAIGDMDEGYTRVWLDESVRRRVLFTSSDQDGLFRWSIEP